MGILSNILGKKNSAGVVPKNGILVPMSGYREFLTGLSRKLNTTNMDKIYANHQAYCAKCGMQYSREALAHLHLFGPGSDFMNQTIMGATREGSDLRSGRCPQCRHTKLKIVIS